MTLSSTLSSIPLALWGDAYVYICLPVLAGLLGLLLNRPIERWVYRDRVRVRLIRSSRHHLLPALEEFYDNVFPPELRISFAEIARWLPPRPQSRKPLAPCHYLVAATRDDKIIGVLKAIICDEAKLCYIAYIGIDKADDLGRRLASRDMLNWLLLRLRRRHRSCRTLLGEVSPDSGRVATSPAAPDASTRLWKDTARRAQLVAYEIDVDFIQPTMRFIDGNIPSEEQALRWLYVPLEAAPQTAKTELSKMEALRMLHFVLFEIYDPTFRGDAAKQEAYRKYLREINDIYAHILPKNVRLL